MAFEREGGTCVFSSEKDRFACKTYQDNFGELPSGDIDLIDPSSIPAHDVLVGGFPCQPFSLAGVSKKQSLGRAHGFRDQTQGTLFFRIASILDARRPRAFLLENVKNLVSHDRGRTFSIILGTLQELGYHAEHAVLDAKYYVPQHRERIFIAGFDKMQFQTPPVFKFPDPPAELPLLGSILEKNPHPRYTISDKLWKWHQDYAKKHKSLGHGFGFGLVRPDSTTRTLSARYYKDGAEILLEQEGRNPRKLTPRECARLMGFPDSFKIPVSDTQAYKQFGNSVVVPLASAVAGALVRAAGLQ
jgi:DNA (cytosine-5)-methyltransferase 1